jgi:hypothetical protein
MFPNIDKLSKIACPVLVIHNTTDRVVPFWHGQYIYEHVPVPVEPLFIKGGGHNALNMTEEDFYKRVQRFILAVESGNLDLSSRRQSISTRIGQRPQRDGSRASHLSRAISVEPVAEVDEDKHPDDHTGTTPMVGSRKAVALPIGADERGASAVRVAQLYDLLPSDRLSGGAPRGAGPGPGAGAGAGVSSSAAPTVIVVADASPTESPAGSPLSENGRLT